MKIKTEKLGSLISIIVSFFMATTVSAQKPAIEWAIIPAGTFTMGSPVSEVDKSLWDNETQHQITLSAFKMSKYEVTVSQFKTFVDATGYITDADKGTGEVPGSGIWADTTFESKAGVNWECDEKGNLRPETEYDHPVIHVSWSDAKAFADWMGCLLPTEAEWEYACRAGTTHTFNTGNKISTSQANYNGSHRYEDQPEGEFRRKTMPVGSFAPNEWGLYDMHGNVWEWCSDWYGKYKKKVQTDPKGRANGTYKIYRGGSWFDDAWKCRSAFRGGAFTWIRDCFIGFRLVSSE